MHNKEKIKSVIIEALTEINHQLPEKINIDKKNDIPLYGSSGQLDSLGLVNILVAIEEKIEDQFDRSIIIADEKAMSQKNSPFRSVDSLVNYLEKII